MDKVLRLVAHELGAYQRILIINREAYGKFVEKKRWPPHLIASQKRITHEFRHSATTCPLTQESTASLHFTNLEQIGAGTRRSDGVMGDMLVGVVVRTVSPVKPAIRWLSRQTLGKHSSWIDALGRRHP